MTETAYMKRLQLAAARAGSVLYRNNVGMCRDEQGRVVRFGLCVGSSDLIGYTPVKVTPDMVGQTVAVFTAVECKGRKTRSTPQQHKFLASVSDNGGIARLMREPEEWKTKPMENDR